MHKRWREDDGRGVGGGGGGRGARGRARAAQGAGSIIKTLVSNVTLNLSIDDGQRSNCALEGRSS